jgi:hypothetical protein
MVLHAPQYMAGKTEDFSQHKKEVGYMPPNMIPQVVFGVFLSSFAS